MANMSYCRFANTCRDLEDCFDHFDDTDLSKNEKHYRRRILELCKSIANSYTMQDLQDIEDSPTPYNDED